MGDIVNIDAIDAQKPNDSIAQTSLLNRDSGTVQNLTIHNPTDLDYYQIILTNSGTAKNFASIAFDASLGDLEMRLLDAQDHEVRTGTTVDGGKRIDLSGLAAGTYYIRVSGANQATNKYSLTWDRTNYGPAIDAIDAQKPNDSIAQTSLLNRDSGTVQNLTIHNATDLDYYQVILPDKGTSQNFIKIAYDASLGELAFDLYDAQNRLVLTSASATDGKNISLENLAAGT